MGTPIKRTCVRCGEKRLMLAEVKKGHTLTEEDGDALFILPFMGWEMTADGLICKQCAEKEAENGNQ